MTTISDCRITSAAERSNPSPNNADTASSSRSCASRNESGNGTGEASINLSSDAAAAGTREAERVRAFVVKVVYASCDIWTRFVEDDPALLARSREEVDAERDRNEAPRSVEEVLVESDERCELRNGSRDGPDAAWACRRKAGRSDSTMAR